MNTIKVSNSLDPDQACSSGLIWVQTVCKGYLQMTLVDKELITEELLGPSIFCWVGRLAFPYFFLSPKSVC